MALLMCIDITFMYIIVAFLIIFQISFCILLISWLLLLAVVDKFETAEEGLLGNSTSGESSGTRYCRLFFEYVCRIVYLPPEGYSWKFLVGVCRPVLEILTLFQTKKCHLCPFSLPRSGIHLNIGLHYLSLFTGHRKR